MADILFTQIATETLRTGTDTIQTSGRNVLGLGSWRYVSDGLANAALAAAHPRFAARSANGRYWRAIADAGKVPVEVGGARGDGLSDDGPAIRATFAYAAAIGARGAAFGSPKYRVEQIAPSEQVVVGNPPLQVLPASSGNYDYGGAAFSRLGGGKGITFSPFNSGSVIDLPLAQDVLAGARDVTLQSGATAALAVGDTVMWQFGELPFDTPETLNWSFATVEAISGATVSLDRPIPEALILASVTGANKRLRKLNVLRDVAISDLSLSGPNFEDGVYLYCAERVRIQRVGGKAMGAGIVSAQYCDGLTIDDCWQEGSWLAQPSFGAAFNFAESRNVLLNRPRARGTTCLVQAEAGAHVAVIGGMFENTLRNGLGESLGKDIVVLNAVGRSTMTVHDLTIAGYGGYRLVETGNGVAGYDGAVALSGTLRLRHPTAPYSIPLNGMAGTLDVTIAGIREVYHFGRLRHWKKRFVLRDGEYRYAFGPAGLLTRARAYVTPGVTIGAGQQLSGLWIGRQSDNGLNYADGPNRKLEPGKDVNIPCYAGTVAGVQWTYRNEPLSLLCVTPPGAGLNTANEFVEFEGWFAEQPDLDVTLGEDAVRIAGDGRDPYEALFPAYDLPAIAAGARVAVTLPISDMNAADFIESVRFVGGFAGLELRGAEALAGAVQLTIVNPGAVAIDRAPSDLGISFFRQIIGN